MSRLSIVTRNRAQTTVEELYKDLERRIIASPPGLCPGYIALVGEGRYAVEHAGEVPVPKNAPPTGKRVAVVGGGPGGLSAACYLALMGHDVTIYERRDHLGGMLRYGIPEYRLPKETLDKEINSLLATGIYVKTGVSVGKELTVEELRKEYDAVYIAIGAHTDKKIGIEGEEAESVISAVEMLRASGEGSPMDFTGQRVIVIGGGNVAMDVARSAVRLGAEKVQIVYRRRQEDMTALQEEVHGAVAEGCEILEPMAPLCIRCNEQGRADGLWVKPQLIGQVRGGRPAPGASSQEEIALPCDKIIVAIGQGIETQPFEESGIPVKRGVIEALNWSGIQDIPGVFAGGDCVTGSATVIRAIAAGKVAAANIDEYLGYHHEIAADIEIPKIRLHNRKPCGRVTMKERDAGERIKDFELIECGMTDEEAAKQNGIPIPTLCYLKDINEIGACRVCLVELEGKDRLITACNNVVEEGMVIYTNSPKVRQARITNVRLILSQHDCNCPTCVRSGNCSLQKLAKKLPIAEKL